MLAIDIALLVGGGVLLVAAAFVVGGRIERRAKAQERRQLGARNAELEKQRLEESCTVCGESIDPKHDVFDSGRWWHKGCYREALR